MKLIAVISHKGGAGKTTSSVQIAEELARRGLRTLLVDADRQQGAGLLLGIDAPAGCVQRTGMPQLDYLGSARLTDLEIADCYAGVANRFDVGVVDTPSLDDALARAWLREAAAALMVLQVDPLTVKTLPSALNTLQMVRAFKPTIQILGLLPTMFDQNEEAHGRLLAELLSRRPEAVFTPVVPADSGLMHRANSEECPPIGEAACLAYQCAVDRILRALESSEPSVPLAQASTPAPRMAPEPAPVPPARSPSAPVVEAPARAWQEPPPAVPASAATPAPAAAAPAWAGSVPSSASTEPSPAAPVAAAPVETPSRAAPPVAAADLALEALASRPAEEPRRERSAENTTVPDWWPRHEVRVDPSGVVRRQESWLVRSRFAIACTIACLALLAAIVLGTTRRVPVNGIGPAWSGHLPAALAGTRGERTPRAGAGAPSVKGHSAEARSHKRSSARKHARHSASASRSNEHGSPE